MPVSIPARSHWAPFRSRFRDERTVAFGPSTITAKNRRDCGRNGAQTGIENPDFSGISTLSTWPKLGRNSDGPSTDTPRAVDYPRLDTCCVPDARGSRDEWPPVRPSALPAALLRGDAGATERGAPSALDLFLAAFVLGSLIPLAIVIVAWTPRIVWTVLAGSIDAIPWWLWALALLVWALASVVETIRMRQEIGR